MILKAMMMRKLSKVGIAAVLLVAVGCANEPSVTNNTLVSSPRDGSPVVSICYAATASTRDQIIALARERCPANRQTLQVWEHDTFVNDCPLAKKNRVSFICRP